MTESNRKRHAKQIVNGKHRQQKLWYTIITSRRRTHRNLYRWLLGSNSLHRLLGFWKTIFRPQLRFLNKIFLKSRKTIFTKSSRMSIGRRSLLPQEFGWSRQKVLIPSPPPLFSLWSLRSVINDSQPDNQSTTFVKGVKVEYDERFHLLKKGYNPNIWVNKTVHKNQFLQFSDLNELTFKLRCVWRYMKTHFIYYPNIIFISKWLKNYLWISRRYWRRKQQLQKYYISFASRNLRIQSKQRFLGLKRRLSKNWFLNPIVEKYKLLNKKASFRFLHRFQILRYRLRRSLLRTTKIKNYIYSHTRKLRLAYVKRRVTAWLWRRGHQLRQRRSLPFRLLISPQKNNIFVVFTDWRGRVKKQVTAKTLGYRNRDKRPFFVLKEVMYIAMQEFLTTCGQLRPQLVITFNNTAYLGKARAMVTHLQRCFKRLNICSFVQYVAYAHGGTKASARKRRRNKWKNRFVKNLGARHRSVRQIKWTMAG